MKKRALRLLLLGLLSLFALPRSAPAAVCAPQLLAPLDEFAQSTHVFRGRVIARYADSTKIGAIIRVDTSWKGAATPEVLVVTGLAGTPFAAEAQFNFVQDQDYLVYARDSQGLLITSYCSRTRLVSDAGDDLRVLGAGTPIGEPAPAWMPTAGSGGTGRGAPRPPLAVLGAVALLFAALILSVARHARRSARL